MCQTATSTYCGSMDQAHSKATDAAGGISGGDRAGTTSEGNKAMGTTQRVKDTVGEML